MTINKERPGDNTEAILKAGQPDPNSTPKGYRMPDLAVLS